MSDPVLAQVAVVPGALDYSAPSAYYPGTLWVYINGVLVEQDGVEGVDELGGSAFRLREPLRDGDTLHVYYQEEGTTHSPFPIPPSAVAALNLVPIPASAPDLAPLGDTAEEYLPSATPVVAGAIDLLPDGVAAIDLIPVPLSSEEI